MMIFTEIKTLFISLLLIVSITVLGQSNKEKETIADRYMVEKNYSKASSIYQKLLKSDSLNIELLMKYANSEFKQLNYTSTYQITNKIISLKQDSISPKAYFYFAESAQYLGKYKEAISAYNKYIKYGLSSSLRRQSEQSIESCNFAISSQNDSTKYIITHLPPPINTKYSEFNPVAITETELVFSRYESINDDSTQDVFNKINVSDIFVAKQTQQGWQKPVLFSENLSSNKYFTGNICFSKNKRVAYFTRCINEDGHIGLCQIYRSEYKSGKWKKPKNVGNKINIPNYSSTHPFLVEFDNYNILYFSSNRPNGYGGYDIWFAYIKNNNVINVNNIGSNINTKENELTPYYSINEGILYFSSNGGKGFGGYDIYKSIGALSKWSPPTNLGLPINSPANDLYYSQRNNGKTIFLSSNRIGSYFHDNMTNCCGDIYIAHSIDKIEKPLLPDSIQSNTTQEDSTTTAIKDLLPLSLYFENDMPDPKSLKTKTKSNYKDLLAEYITAKQTYRREYSKGLSGEEKAVAESQIDSFFINKVESGYSDLQKFANLLSRELEAGKQVRIKIRGYASPLNTREYNLALSKRRISSLVNYITEYKDGYFLPYINNTAPNKASLSIYQDPLGDSQSIGIVSSNPNDKRNSVYSREAALQRKIQIIMYSSSDKDININDYPELHFTTDKINMGEIKQGNNKSIIVNFENKGKSELKFNSVSADCKCLQIQMNKAVYQSNEKGKFYVLLRTRNLKPGNYSQKIYTNTNEIGGHKFIWINFVIE